MTDKQPAQQAAPENEPDKPEVKPEPPAEEKEIRCTLCGLRACWT